MRSALKAEFRKLLTVRSTYGVLLATLIAMIFFGGYVFGFNLDTNALQNPTHLADVAINGITFVAIIGALVPVFLMAHEYRYSTIMYAFTASRHRTTVLLAKIIMSILFSLTFTVSVCVLSPLMTLLGVALSGHQLVPQSIAYGDIIWRALFYGTGFGLMGLLLAVLLRNLIGAVVALLIIPSTVEQLLSLLLKNNSAYLPFNALGSVIQHNNNLSYGSAAIVYSIYMIIGYLVAWWLFMERDAN